MLLRSPPKPSRPFPLALSKESSIQSSIHSSTIFFYLFLFLFFQWLDRLPLFLVFHRSYVLYSTFSFEPSRRTHTPRDIYRIQVVDSWSSFTQESPFFILGFLDSPPPSSRLDSSGSRPAILTSTSCVSYRILFFSLTTVGTVQLLLTYMSTDCLTYTSRGKQWVLIGNTNF